MNATNNQTDLVCLAAYLIAAQFISHPASVVGACFMALAHLLSLMSKGSRWGVVFCSVSALIGFVLMIAAVQA